VQRPDSQERTAKDRNKGIDPALFRFVALNSANGDKGIDEWEKALPTAVLIVNGSYYDLKGRPDTPIISNGVAIGPTTYDAKAGAFTAGDGFASIKELSNQTWQTALTGATNAMVSYPLLIGSDGQTHVRTASRWLGRIDIHRSQIIAAARWIKPWK
jgi:hypothetical protein